MSYPRQETNYESYPRTSTQRLAKPQVRMPILSPREKRIQHNIGEPDLSYLYKKPQMSNYSSSPKTDGLSAGLKLSNKEYSVEERNNPTARLTVERMKSLSINPTEKSGIASTSKFSTKTPRNIDIEPRFNPQPVHSENMALKKHATMQSNFENFVSRYSKLANTASLPNPQPQEFSTKSYGQVNAYASCTNQGLVRNYNEDRVTTALNLQRPLNSNNPNERWPLCHIFCVFDGHGGERCANFLQERIHHYIVKSKYFPWKPEEALREACEEADKDFIEIALAAEESETRRHDKSGSCGLIMLILDNKCYLCNVGDSRAVLSQKLGDARFALTRDHKPCDALERQRVLEAGGKIYQNFPTMSNGKRMDDPSLNGVNMNVPFRISPGRLSISRSFGDIEAKLARFGGNPNVLICQPEITTLPLTDDIDFIVMGSDGIYDVLSNEEVIGIVWNTINSFKQRLNIHEIMKLASESIIKEALIKKSLDNVTALVVCFGNFEESRNPEQILAKPIMQNELKIQRRWNDPQDDERAQTERRRLSKSMKRVYRGQNGLPFEVSALEEMSGYGKSNQSIKSFVASPNMKFNKVALDKRQLNYEVKPSIDFPKIIKLRTPR